jgi:hypothetical protein
LPEKSVKCWAGDFQPVTKPAYEEHITGLLLPDFARDPVLKKERTGRACVKADVVLMIKRIGE